MTTIKVIKGDQLTTRQVSAWSNLQRTEPTLDSPYFRPEFTRTVASVRDDVEVAVLEEDGKLVGFFPYQRDRSDIAWPVGGAICDFQGVIASRDSSWNAEQFVRGCGLVAWHFNHLVASQKQVRKYHWMEAPSPYMDLRGGFDAYRNSRCRPRSQELAQSLRKRRKIQREIGPLRFVAHVGNKETFQTLIAWKREQYRRTKTPDFLAPDWVVETLERIVNEQNEAFSGMLSVLYAGDDLAAIHLGMRSYDVLHWWYPTYNVRLQKYSPGMVLLLELAQASHSLGISRIDLGKGSERYKTGLMSGSVSVAEGSVDLRPVSRIFRRNWFRMREFVRTSAFERPARSVVRHARSWLSYH